MANTSIATGDEPANGVFSSNSDNGTIPLIAFCHAYDHLFDIANDRPGGSTTNENAVCDWLLEFINDRPADSEEAAAWRGRLLGRAASNGWNETEVRRLGRMVTDDSQRLGLSPY